MSGRPPKENIDFSGWDVTILDNDEKIDALIDAQGIGAFTVYFYLCQKAYGSNGYYLDWSYSRCATTARKLGRGASAEFVKNVVNMCFQCCLFDKGLFDKYGILTSRGIQKRYWQVAKSRNYKTVISDYWLLEQDECPGLNKSTLKSNYDTPKSNYDTPKSNYQTLKESKVKESKVNETISAPDDKRIEQVLSVYERIIGTRPTEITGAVKRNIAINLNNGIDFYELFNKVAKSTFLRESRWCTFDWIIRPDNVKKILSGKYDDKSKVPNEPKAKSYNLADIETIDEFK